MRHGTKKEVQTIWIDIKRGGYKMIVKTFKLGNTTIEVDDEFYPKTEEENELVYEEFNRIGWEILKMSEK